MRGGFRRLVNPGTPVSRVEVEGSREERERVRAELRLRQHLVGLFDRLAPGDGRLSISPLTVSEGGDGEGGAGRGVVG